MALSPNPGPKIISSVEGPTLILSPNNGIVPHGEVTDDPISTRDWNIQPVIDPQDGKVKWTIQHTTEVYLGSNSINSNLVYVTTNVSQAYHWDLRPSNYLGSYQLSPDGVQVATIMFITDPTGRSARALALFNANGTEDPLQNFYFNV